MWKADPLGRFQRDPDDDRFLKRVESDEPPGGWTFIGQEGLDIDGDGVVAVPDLLLLLAQWGPCPPNCLGDLNGDGSVNVPDLLELLANWGPCP